MAQDAFDSGTLPRPESPEQITPASILMHKFAGVPEQIDELCKGDDILQLATTGGTSRSHITPDTTAVKTADTSKKTSKIYF